MIYKIIAGVLLATALVGCVNENADGRAMPRLHPWWEVQQ